MSIPNFPMISPRHVSAAARGCLVWEEPGDNNNTGGSNTGRHHHNRNNNYGSNANSASAKHSSKHKSATWEEELLAFQQGPRHSPGRARVGPPPTLRVLHRAGGHEHDSNEGIKQSIMVEKRNAIEYAFPAWGGAGGGYYSCFNYKGGGKDARGRYDGALDVVATKETQGRRRVLDQDHLAIGATASSFVPMERPHGLRPVKPPQLAQPLDGKDKRGLHQDIGVLNVERHPSRKRMCNEQYEWLRNSYNVMTEAAAPTDTRTHFQIFADYKRQRNRQARKDFLAHLKSEGQFKAVNRVPIRSTLTQRRWDQTPANSNNAPNGGQDSQHPTQQQQQQEFIPHPPPAVSAQQQQQQQFAALSPEKQAKLLHSLSPRARRYLGQK